MTLEEAQQLKPGDIISGASRSIRLLTRVEINDKYLLWDEDRGDGIINTGHRYEYANMHLVKKAIPQVINNYPIY